MAIMIIGLILFLGVHSSSIWFSSVRGNFIAKHGETAWKILYSAISLIGFIAILYGYSKARMNPVYVYTTTIGMHHLAALLMLFAFTFLAAAYVPKNGIKARFHHPMVISVMFWAVAHLLVKGTVASIVLFGSFLVWAILSFISARKRDRKNHTSYAQGQRSATLVTIAIGVIAWFVFAMWVHVAWLGIQPVSWL